MASFDSSQPSPQVLDVLCLLKQHHNVLISGPPAVGKSQLLAELRFWFSNIPKTGFSAKGRTAFPPVSPIEDCLPSPDRTERKVLSTTFHQGTKYRDFVSGLTPNVGPKAESAFKVTHGLLYRGIEAAASANTAVLIEIDEINRGPAVTIFGDTITAIEGDKRLLPDGQLGPLTTTFGVLDERGEQKDISLPHQLYIVAAMNEADTSVEPLDVAFLRRFRPYRLFPDEAILRNYLGLPAEKQALAVAAATGNDVYEAAVQAWSKINGRIELARGSAFQIGHGIFMAQARESVPTELNESLDFVADVWPQLYAHITEVFFGDTRGAAATLRAGEPGSAFQLEEVYFSNAPVVRLTGPTVVKRDSIYEILTSVAGGD